MIQENKMLNLARDSSLLLLGGGLDPLLGDEGLEDPGVWVLGVAKVDNLIQNLVDEDKVVLDVLLTNFAEVVLHHLDHFKEELKDHGGVDILLGDGRQPQVGPLDVEDARFCDFCPVVEIPFRVVLKFCNGLLNLK